MRRKRFWLGGAAAIAVALVALGGADSDASDVLADNGVPERYWNLSNPLMATPDIVHLGRTIYIDYCQRCHGPTGEGDGYEARFLDPPPGVLSLTLRTGNASDPFLYWTIFEGGIDLGTQMPSFGNLLSNDQIWAVIHHLRDRYTDHD